ncbi:MAG TPA: VOC family protein [Methylomirabilota bacterium]|nr:VOC family protein [Methylomirabilota bacterium]
MTIFGIATVAVVVSNRRNALAWYTKVLGLQATYIGPHESNPDPTVQGSPDKPGHWIEVGPSRPFTRIHLCESADGNVESGQTGITLLTDDIKSEYAQLKQKGVQFLSQPKKMDWGEWICEFTDPDGNEFDLKQPIPLTG